jgi:hypothetical protein
MTAEAPPPAVEAPPPAEPASPPAPRPGTVVIRARASTGAAFRLVRVNSWVDGREVFACQGDRLPPGAEIELFEGSLPPGDHHLLVIAEYSGNGHHVFSYFDQYHYRARSSTQFRLGEGDRADLTVDLRDRGGANTAFEDRLAIAFRSR